MKDTKYFSFSAYGVAFSVETELPGIMELIEETFPTNQEPVVRDNPLILSFRLIDSPHSSFGSRDHDYRIEDSRFILRVFDEDTVEVDEKNGKAVIRLDPRWISSSPMFVKSLFIEAPSLVLISWLKMPYIHAAAVAYDGRGIVLTGQSGSGKSALAYACIKLGFDYLVRYGAGLMGVFFLFYLGSYIETKPLSGKTDYFSYTLVGFTLSHYLSMILVALSRTLRDDQLIGTVEPVMSSPVSPVWIATGASLFPLIESTTIACLQLGLGYFFLGADFQNANWTGFIVIAFVSIFCMQALAFLSATFVIIFKKGDPITPFLAASAFVFTGAFFPFERLPWVFRWLSYCIPTTYFLKGARMYIFQGLELFNPTAWINIKILIIFAAAAVPAAAGAFAGAVRYARKQGTLCHY